MSRAIRKYKVVGYTILVVVLAVVDAHSANDGRKMSSSRDFDNPKAAGSRMFAAINDASPSLIEAMAASEEKEQALFGKWEHCCGSRSSLDADPARFFGFVEGVTRATPPVRWRYAVTRQLRNDRSLRANDHALVKELLDAGVLKEDPTLTDPAGKPRLILTEPETKDSKIGVTVDQSVDVTLINSNAKISDGSGVVIVEADLFRRYRGKHCSMHAAQDVAVFAFTDNLDGKPLLICWDMKTQQLRWSQSLWGFGRDPSFALGVWRHRVELRRSRDAILVFGHGNLGAYIEGLRIEDGASIFRFSIDYWGTDRRPR